MVIQNILAYTCPQLQIKFLITNCTVDHINFSNNVIFCLNAVENVSFKKHTFISGLFLYQLWLSVDLPGDSGHTLALPPT